MSLTQKAVENIAHLARLSLEPNNIDNYVDSLSNLLTFIEQMNEIDTEAVEPLAHPLDVMQPMRKDTPEVVTKEAQQDFQALAPKTEAALYLVPQVIE